MDKSSFVRLLESFKTVSEVHSFSKAADFLGISKSQVSRNITQLETHLDKKLLHRTTRSLSLTEGGVDLLNQCIPLLDELSEIRRRNLNEKSIITGSIKVTAPPQLGINTLTPIISEFLKKYPEVSVQLDLSTRIHDLTEESIDVAIRLGTIKDSGLYFSSLGNETIRLTCSKNFLKKHTKPKTIAQLRKLPLIVTNYKANYRFKYHIGEKSFWTSMSPVLYVNSTEAALQAVKAGLGISSLTEEMIHEHKLVHLLPKVIVREKPIYLLYQERKSYSLKLKTFIEFIEDRWP